MRSWSHSLHSLAALAVRARIPQHQSCRAASSQAASTTSAPKATSHTARDNANKAEVKIPELLELARPLGLPDPPRTTPLTEEEKLAKYLDPQKRLEERNHLLEEITTDYYEDVIKLKWHAGKSWVAPKVLILEDKALYFPNIVGKVLTNCAETHSTDLCKGHISIVNIITTKLSETQIKAYGAPTLEKFGDHPLFRYVQINLQENAAKSFLVMLFLNSLRSQNPSQLHSTYLVSKQNMEYLRKPMGLENKFVGYVYLVDQNCKIRWAAGADPGPDEINSLERCTTVLIDRLDAEKNCKRERDRDR